jgi:hypothetical protein
LNALLAMRHSGLLSADQRLPAAGHELLRVGKIYRPDSVAFLDLLANRVLTDGKHLDLMFWVDEQNRAIDASDKKTSDRYFAVLDKALVAAGVIVPRDKDPAKAHFIRDEPKLWNKLRLLARYSPTRYFHEGHGLAFDWRKIVAVLDDR